MARGTKNQNAIRGEVDDHTREGGALEMSTVAPGKQSQKTKLSKRARTQMAISKHVQNGADYLPLGFADSVLGHSPAEWLMLLLPTTQAGSRNCYRKA